MLLPIFACLMLCGRQVTVSVEARATPQAHAQTRFTMAAIDPNVRPANPDYIAISTDVARALTSQGFQQAKTPDEADLVVLIDWMTSDPKVNVRHIGGDAGEPQVRGAPPGRSGMPVGGTNNYGSFGFGYDATDALQASYVHTFILKGVPLAAYRSDPAARPVWDVTLTGEGDTGEPAKIAPQIVAAAMPYIAQDAGKAKVRLGATEDPVRYVRGEIPSPFPTRR